MSHSTSVSQPPRHRGRPLPRCAGSHAARLPPLRMLPRFLAAALLALAAAAPAAARTIEGQTFDDKLQLAGTPLQLNGVGLRQVAWFKGYAAGLYLSRKAATPAEALAAPGAKRLQIRMLVEVDTLEFSKSFGRGIRRNTPAAELPALLPRMEQFDAQIRKIGKVKVNDVIDLDFLPGRGLQMSVNGRPHGEPIAGEDLYAALLRIFLGDKPSDPELKTGLLGQGP